jgi:hypothetical protein
MTIRDAEVSLVDGGVVANNPSDLALAEAQGLAGGDHPLGHFRVVSLGTGRYIRRLEPGNWGWLRWASPIIDVMFGAGSEAVDLALKRRLPEECYLRCQVRLEGANDAMDDGSKDNLNKLISITQAHLDSEGREKLVKRVLEMCGVKDRDQMRRETEELKSRIVARGLLLAKFQSLSKQAEERLGQLSLEDLEKLKKMVARDEARSLRELGLED